MAEIRKDPLSGDWIILSPGRVKRPHMLASKKKLRTPSPKTGCPFENLLISHNPIITQYPAARAGTVAAKKWRIAVVPNKYPVLTYEHGSRSARSSPRGFYDMKTGVGEHELVITRDHSRFFADLAPGEAAKVLELFQERYRAVAKEGSSAYAVSFLNYGSSVGASLWHPHYQFLAIPFIPPHVISSLAGARAYFKKHHRCVRCDILREERTEKKRIIAENAHAIAFAPYSSKRPFEVSIVPKKHFPYFEKTPATVIRAVAALGQLVLARMKENAGDPDLNFFIHSAPIDGKRYDYHHWHMEIFPFISSLGGFEFGTSVYINVVDPNEAAAILRGEPWKPL